MRITELQQENIMEKLVTVEVRRKAKIDEEWVIDDTTCSAVVSDTRVVLLLNNGTTLAFDLNAPRNWWLETDKGAFMGAFIRTSTYEINGIEVTSEWEYVVRSI